jgi:peptide subunit release factor 1 (eRF1)
MYDAMNTHGIILVSGEQTICYKVQIGSTSKYSNITKIASREYTLPNHHRRGGQSSNRFRGIREKVIGDQVTESVLMMIKAYVGSDGICQVKSIVLGGPADMKHQVRDHALTQQYFGKCIEKIVTTNGLDDQTIHTVYKECLPNFIGADMKEALDVLNRVKEIIETGDIRERLVFGLDEVTKGISEYSLETIVYSSILDDSAKKLMGSYVTGSTYELPGDLMNPYNIIGVKWF